MGTVVTTWTGATTEKTINGTEEGWVIDFITGRRWWGTNNRKGRDYFINEIWLLTGLEGKIWFTSYINFISFIDHNGNRRIKAWRIVYIRSLSSVSLAEPLTVGFGVWGGGSMSRNLLYIEERVWVCMWMYEYLFVITSCKLVKIGITFDDQGGNSQINFGTFI